jgi:hypothetical protein
MLFGVKYYLTSSRKKTSLRVLENGVLRGAFEPKSGEVRDNFRKVHNINHHHFH